MITAYASIFAEKLDRLEARLARMSDEKSPETIALREMLASEASRLRRVFDALEPDDTPDFAA